MHHNKDKLHLYNVLHKEVKSQPLDINLKDQFSHFAAPNHATKDSVVWIAVGLCCCSSGLYYRGCWIRACSSD